MFCESRARPERYTISFLLLQQEQLDFSRDARAICASQGRTLLIGEPNAPGFAGNHAFAVYPQITKKHGTFRLTVPAPHRSITHTFRSVSMRKESER